MINYFQTIINSPGESASSRRWARQPLVIGLVFSLSVFAFATARPNVQTITKEFDEVIAQGKKLSDSGQFAAALPVFERATRIARSADDSDREAVALIWSGNCQLRLFRYRSALSSLEAGAERAMQANDKTRAGIAISNIGQIEYLLGDYALAIRKQEQAIRLLSDSPRQDALTRAWINYSGLQIRLGDSSQGRQSFDRAIVIARRAGLAVDEAIAWHQRAAAILALGERAEAERSLRKAADIFQQIGDKDALAAVAELRAEIELQKGQNLLALHDADAALAARGLILRSIPEYYLVHIRAQILLGLGRKSEAVSEFRRAADLATIWRQSAMPGDASSMQTVAYLHDIYQDYAELAAELSIERHDPALSKQALEALEENRAASLREQLALALSQNSRLPSRYFELLSALQAAQAKVTLGNSSAENEIKLRDIRLELSELENKIGIEQENISSSKEKTRLRNSLRDIQTRLGQNQALLSFCLGKRKSFLWAVSGEAVNLYELPAENEIAEQVKAFSTAVQSGKIGNSTGFALSHGLFGQLTAAIWQKPDWLITAEGALLNGVPFPALPDLSAAQNGQLLATNHSIRLLPSELLLLSSTATPTQNGFLGIGDPIYNLADSRRARSVMLQAAGEGHSVTALARLPASDRELKAAAKQSGFASAQLLVGSEANGAALRNALAQAPAVVHFAVHVVSPAGKPDQAALALSLTKENVPELLTREVIATYHVPGSLVVMSGCSSGQGRALPSVGLIGLSRAWLLAGADAVIASAWPTPDDSGPFFASFYSHLKTIKSGSFARRAAAALQQAQLEMQRSGGYRSSASFWAAYSIVSKE